MVNSLLESNGVNVLVALPVSFKVSSFISSDARPCMFSHGDEPLAK